MSCHVWSAWFCTVLAHYSENVLLRKSTIPKARVRDMDRVSGVRFRATVSTARVSRVMASRVRFRVSTVRFSGPSE